MFLRRIVWDIFIDSFTGTAFSLRRGKRENHYAMSVVSLLSNEVKHLLLFPSLNFGDLFHQGKSIGLH